MIKVLLVLLISLYIEASEFFNESQAYNIKRAYKIGKQIKADNGLTFENTLASIIFSESSAGKFILGDKDKYIRNCSLGPYQIRLSTAKWIIKKDPFLRKYFGGIKNEDTLITMLLTKTDFGALVSGRLLRFWYNYALHKGVKKPWDYAVSRYNGGIHNKKYVSKIRRNMKVIRENIKDLD